MKIKAYWMIILLMCAFLLPLSGFSETQSNTDNNYFSIVAADNELILCLVKDQFYEVENESIILECLVFYGRDIRDDIQIINEDGTVVAIVQNNGSGLAADYIRLINTTAHIGTLYAISGGTISPEVTYTILQCNSEPLTPDIGNVIDGLESFLTTIPLDDPSSEETIKHVVEYLNVDPRVNCLEQIDHTVFFVTQDGYIGSYNIGIAPFGEAGKTDLTSAYAQVKERPDKYLPNDFINSNYALTNGRILIVRPQMKNDTEAEAGTMLLHYAAAVSMANTLKATIDAQFGNGDYAVVKTLVDDKARESLLEGDISDCGILILNAHGNLIGGKRLYINMGESEGSGSLFLKYHDALWADMRVGERMWLEARGAYDLSVDSDGKIHRSIFLTTNYFASALKNKQFENTIVYLFICYGTADEEFVNLFLSHGAACVIGCKDSFSLALSLETLAEITQSLAYPDDDGVYGTIQEGMDQVEEIRSLHTLEHFLYMPGAFLDGESAYMLARKNLNIVLHSEDKDYRIEDQTENELLNGVEEWLNMNMQEAYRNHVQVDCISVNNGNIRIAGSGTVIGRIMSVADQGDQRPIENAEVKFYRWFNHSFIEDQRFKTQTNSKGYYEVPLPYGLWVVEAQYGDVKEFVALQHTSEHSTAEDIQMKLYLEGYVVTQMDMRVNGPAANASIYAVQDGRKYMANTDADGHYQVCVHPGNYSMYAIYWDNSLVSVTDECNAALTKDSCTVPTMTCGYTEYGYVFDADTGLPIAGALVKADTKLYQTGTTDENGFWYANVGLQGTDIHFSAEGYEDADFFVHGLEYGQSFRFDITLKPDVDELALYYQYLREVLVPKEGLATEGAEAFTGEWNIPVNSTNVRDHGLISAAVFDADLDGHLEMLVVSIDRFESTSLLGDPVAEIDFIKYLYRIKDGKVFLSDCFPIRDDDGYFDGLPNVSGLVYDQSNAAYFIKYEQVKYYVMLSKQKDGRIQMNHAYNSLFTSEEFKKNYMVRDYEITDSFTVILKEMDNHPGWYSDYYIITGDDTFQTYRLQRSTLCAVRVYTLDVKQKKWILAITDETHLAEIMSGTMDPYVFEIITSP